jgi:hypothetical protein
VGGDVAARAFAVGDDDVVDEEIDPMKGVLAAFLLLPAALAAEPLHLNDPTPRDVLVQVENSGNPGVVGQSFAPPVPATYSASGGTGTLVIPIESHQALRMSPAIPPVPGSFTPFVISIDLATGAATSQPASGAHAGGGQTFSFTTNALATSGPAGFMPSQAQVFCTSGAGCTLVPGAPYDPLTGEINLVGSEVQEGCDGSFCIPPVTFFSRQGDLRLSEAPVVPALPGLAGAVLFLGLGCAAAFRRRSN